MREQNNRQRVARIALIAAGALLFLCVVVPFLIPVPPLEGTVQPEDLADSDSAFIGLTVGGVEGYDVHYKTFGEGEPVFVMLHGFNANLYSFRQVTGPFSEYGRVIVLDRPASGLSERLTAGDFTPPNNPYTNEAQIDVVIGLMDALGVEQAVLVGHSAGGTVAMDVALAHPERVEGLILISPAIYAGGGPPPFVGVLLALPQFNRLGPLVSRAFVNSGNLLEGGYHDPTRIEQETIELAEKSFQVDNWDRALWELTRASRMADFEDRLDEVTMPALIVTGDDDRVVPTEQSVRLAGELPNAEIRVIEACGHVAHEECPVPFLRAVDSFLADLE
ncbi:MAG: alpha/beta fold hydrolase [Chloroflexi bacterium]|nr:alpha/beta fold hydrolase [Chloroflexota bacterium]